MSKKLTTKDFCEVAQQNRWQVEAIKAVAKAESLGGGFYKSGHIKILFERHKFYKYASRKLVNYKGRKIQQRELFRITYPQICQRKAGGYYGGLAEYKRFNLAFKLDPKAAMMATSWGMFQIMGFNYALVGFRSVNELVDYVKLGEAEQLDVFARFVKHTGLSDELRNKQWARFARGYNGKGYRRNKYDAKMARFYTQYKRQNIDCKGLLTPAQKDERFENVELADAEKLLQDNSLIEEQVELEIDNQRTDIEPNHPLEPSQIIPTKNKEKKVIKEDQDEDNLHSSENPQEDSAQSLPTLEAMQEKISQFEQISNQVGVASEKLGGVSKSSWFTVLLTWLGSLAQGIKAFTEENPILASVLVITAVITFGYGIWYLTRSKERQVSRKEIARGLIR